ncbi:alpha-hydroxy acid oxidase [Zobellia galactanivorans]|uniref:alpha-hydroxy acid oxidase n=1 Tax=Zobellia galactanivorans (strain DSM 12802 / CCUG 47099 / CIP 106680 / NCIMB 13871 / Dsij) TaxID=63186 RepID=UPI001C06722E|nr:alpha-hydroxy acid oxidase [Zobellia galactanivorans]MBU3025333.1 alpha-hydroxy-acid oxidizing protein [Zobellia galactanivorans]
MAAKINSAYPSVDDLRTKAKKRVPKFAFEYLDGGCNEDVSISRNTSDIRKVQLQPRYLRNYGTSSTKTKVLGMEFDAPFGIAPVGLQGLMWPNSPEILAKAAYAHNIPFILSTVTTMSIERASEITEGKAWFQLYNPVEDTLRDDIIKRAEAAQCPVLVLLCDVPTFGYRPRDIRNGLALPPKMSLTNILQILGKPTWAMNTLKYGQPTFETLKPYTPEGLNLRQLGQFMDKTFSGRLNEEKIKPIRDKWKGKLVLKGVASEQDTQDAIRMGFDGIILSNHGGRQLDAAESTIHSLHDIAPKYGDQIEIMMDSGMRSGPDIARTMASGAKFTFMGRSFMYGVGALGNAGGDHTITMLKTQFKQVMDQLCCERVEDLPQHIIKKQ